MNPTRIIALNNPHTSATGFKGTRILMAEPPRTRSGCRLLPLYCEKPDRLSQKSQNANRKPRPFHALLSQAQAVGTGRNARKIEAGSQDHNVIFELSRASRPEEFGTISVKHSQLVCSFVATDRQIQP